MKQEIWRPVVGFEKYYEISSYGRLRSLPRLKILKIDKAVLNGYKIYPLRQKYGRHIHRLVAIAFIPNPRKKPQVNHKDGDKLNNFVDNIERVTAKENNTH